ncbi:hypothetical protein [Actinoalloteichus sp. GBA129-24]|uniref:hypothetical protein n=1 Tax=Actinoalloteichus sp. GBA129-24 TaxID=1612551 RepID=UPI0009503666|nr:hypothetical protein [Actinoalloteichus sp. GBA129-24]APU19432.1 hypothetical protein UA75_07065 [Actinoalloteichus sp. GBA129-24]
MTEPTRLTERLEEIVSDVEADPSLAHRVLSRGRERRRKRRTIFGAATALTVVLAAGTALTGWLREQEDGADPVIPAQGRFGEPSPVLTERLTGEPRGDLAEDAAFLAEAEALWREQAADAITWLRYPDGLVLTGEPNVHAAFETPAGPVAVITQAITRNDVEAISGVVGPDAQGRTRVLSANPDGGRLLSNFVGPDSRVLVVVDADWGHVSLSEHIDIDPATGLPTRHWREVPLDDHIGIAELDSPSPPEGLDLSPTPEGSMFDGGPAGRAVQPMFPEGRRGDHDEPIGHQTTYPGPLLAGTSSDEDGRPQAIIEVGQIADRSLIRNPSRRLFGALTEAGVIAPLTSSFSELAALALPDGRTALITNVSYGPTAPHLYAVIVDGAEHEVVYGGPIDVESPLPVALRLPDDQGWAVFDHESELRYRDSPDAEWRDARAEQGAALLPPTAVQVEVRDADGGSVVVDLDD